MKRDSRRVKCKSSILQLKHTTQNIHMLKPLSGQFSYKQTRCDIYSLFIFHSFFGFEQTSVTLFMLRLYIKSNSLGVMWINIFIYRTCNQACGCRCYPRGRQTMAPVAILSGPKATFSRTKINTSELYSKRNSDHFRHFLCMLHQISKDIVFLMLIFSCS